MGKDKSFGGRARGKGTGESGGRGRHAVPPPPKPARKAKAQRRSFPAKPEKPTLLDYIFGRAKAIQAGQPRGRKPGKILPVIPKGYRRSLWNDKPDPKNPKNPKTPPLK